MRRLAHGSCRYTVYTWALTGLLKPMYVQQQYLDLWVLLAEFLLGLNMHDLDAKSMSRSVWFVTRFDVWLGISVAWGFVICRF